MQSLDTFFPNLCASQSFILILAYQANSLVKVVFTKFTSKIIWMSEKFLDVSVYVLISIKVRVIYSYYPYPWIKKNTHTVSC